jgi:uncharacterized protein
MTYLHGIEVIELATGVRPIQTVRSAVIGLVGTAPAADAAIWPLDTPVIATGRTMAATLGSGGTLADALDAIWDQAGATVVVVRVAEGANAAATLTNVTGGSAGLTGLHALTKASALLGLTPKILVAPGFSQAPAVQAEIKVVCNTLRAVAFVDGPDTSEAAAIAVAGTLGSARVVPVDPWFTAGPTNAVRAPSAVAAGVLARVDADAGFWHSASNKEVFGVTGTTRPVLFGLTNPNTEANRLNGVGVMTVIRAGGWRLWGARSTSTDPLWAFLSVRRTADMIYESIEQAFLWALDQPFSSQLLLDVRDSVAEYLRTLTARGAILGGDAWIDPELNTQATLRAGQLFVGFDIEPPATLERLSFRAQRNGGYYEELVSSVARTA